MSNSSLKTPGKLFLILGPSGVGKGTIIEILKKKFPQFIFPTSVTTREKRPNETEGDVYYFISKEEFEQKIKNQELLEYALVHKNSYYGTLKSEILKPLAEGKSVVREVDMQGVISIKEILPKEQVITIFITAPNLETLIKRIEKRGKLPTEEIKKRMESAKKELSYSEVCDHIVYSLDNQIDDCVAEVVSIINKENPTT
jgi:guanylate kinase